MFDYLTLVFIVLLVLGLLIGIARGAFKMLSGLVVFAVAVLVAIFLSKPVGAWVQGWGVTKSMNTGIYEFLAGKIDISFGTIHFTGSSQITEADIAAANAAGKLYYGNADFDVFHAAYEAVKLPAVFYQTVDGLINNAIAGYNGQPFAFAQPLADIMTYAVCYAGSFIVLFILTSIVGTIIAAILRHAFARSGVKPGIISRLIGGLAGLVLAAGIVWSLCLLINVTLLMDNAFATHLREVLRYNDPNAWTFAKWLVQTDFGYNAIISFFIK